MQGCGTWLPSTSIWYHYTPDAAPLYSLPIIFALVAAINTTDYLLVKSVLVTQRKGTKLFLL